MDTTSPEPRHGGPSGRWRGRMLRIAGWLALSLALGATFRAYLDPSLTLDLGSFMQMCGLR